MADGDVVPNNHHVTRYCTNPQQQGGVVLGAAFLLRDDESELSVNWLEHLHGGSDRREQLRAARTGMQTMMKLKPNGWFAVLPVEQITSLVEAGGTALTLSVRHHPEGGNDGHAAIHGMPTAINSALATATAAALAQRVTEPLIQNKTLD